MDRSKFKKRFEGKVKVVERCASAPAYLEGDCWEWQGARCGPEQAYGQSSLDGRKQMAHRVAWQLWVGPLDDDCDLDHLCRNPACVNPAHLEPVPHRENIQRGYDVKLEAQGERFGVLGKCCAQGHPYDAKNTHRSPSGGRVCRECRRLAQARWRAAHPERSREFCRRYQKRKKAERASGSE